MQPLEMRRNGRNGEVKVLQSRLKKQLGRNESPYPERLAAGTNLSQL